MHFLQKKYKDLSLPKSGCNLASVFELKGINHVLATKFLREKLHICIKNISIKANRFLVTLFLTDENPTQLSNLPQPVTTIFAMLD
jgi:hypothetical protein